MTAHPNAEILRGMAEGRQVLARFAPHETDYTPLSSASTSALQELIRPGALVNPGRWEFALADDPEQLRQLLGQQPAQSEHSADAI